jgi:hypothetical protein
MRVWELSEWNQDERKQITHRFIKIALRNSQPETKRA